MKDTRQNDQTIQFNWKSELLEWVKIIATAMLIAFVINTFLIANSRIPTGSMENTIMTRPGDRLKAFLPVS